jgi:hypothetical protein
MPNDKCLFTGKTLDSTTKNEHTIPESLGGKISSKLVSSSGFNEFGGDVFVPEMCDAYLFFMHTLSPLLTSRFRKAQRGMDSHDPSIKGVRLREGGIGFAGPVIQSFDGKGNPTGIMGGSAADLREFAESKNIDTSKWKFKKLNFDEMEFSRDIVTMSPTIELGFLISGLMTFDAFRDDGIPFTRSPSLVHIREAFYEYFQTGQLPQNVRWDKICLGFQFDRVEKLTRLRESVDFQSSKFEHQLFVFGDAISRTVDMVFCAFGIDPYGFRLSSTYTGKPFSYIVVNGILRDVNPSGLLNASYVEGPLCGASELGSFYSIFDRESRDQTYVRELVSGLRGSIICDARLLVEQNASEYVWKRIVQSANNEDVAVSIKSLLVTRIRFLFKSKLNDELEEFIDEKLRCVSVLDHLTEMDPKTGRYTVPRWNSVYEIYVKTIGEIKNQFGDCDAFKRYDGWSEENKIPIEKQTFPSA